MSFPQATLPNGTKIRCISKFHVAEIQRQVEQYFQHGIAVQPGDTVFDVGANIGLFTLLVHDMCHGDVDVFAFEPIPAIYEALRYNLQNADTQRLRSFPCGISDRARTARFAYRPNMATLSSVYGDDDCEMQDQVKNALLNNLSAAPLHLRWLKLLPQGAREFLLEKTMRTAFEPVDVQCDLRTLSDILREQSVERIDLLKVDVEKSELDVLQGIDQPDWALIQQVVMEIHDLDGRLDSIRNLLDSNGLSHMIVEQEPILRGSNVYALYAMRPK